MPAIQIRRKETGIALFFDGTNYEEVFNTFNMDAMSLDDYKKSCEYFGPNVCFVLFQSERVLIYKDTYIVQINGVILGVKDPDFKNIYEEIETTV